MNQSSTLSNSDLLRIESICDQFEADRRAGKCPTIESYSQFVGRDSDYRLVGELLRVEWDDRAEKGDPPKLEEYLGRNLLPRKMLRQLFAEWESSELNVGSIGHFQLIEKLGKGSFGTVWKAYDTRLRRNIALKIAHASLLEDSSRFLREAKTASRLQHPNIVRILDAGTFGDRLCILRDYVEGTSLSDQLKHRSYSPTEAASLCCVLAEALAYSHELGCVHRDIKPQNVLIQNDGKPFLIDFGLAKSLSSNSWATQSGTILGTPVYMAPEQAKGQSNSASPSADIYSLGIVLFELLTGHVPFRGNFEMIMLQVINQEPPHPRKFQPDLPVSLCNIALKCIEKDPRARYESAAELAADLNRFANGGPVVAKAVPFHLRMLRRARRNPLLASLTTAVTVLLAVLLVGSIYFAISNHVALQKEIELRKQANDARESAERATVRAKSEAELSMQVTAFLEEVFGATDIVGVQLGNDQISRDFSVRDLNSMNAMQLLNRAVARMDKELANQPRVQARLMDILGNVFRSHGEFEKANELFASAEATRKNFQARHPEFNLDRDEAFHQYFLGRLNQSMGDYSSARDRYLDALGRLGTLPQQNVEPISDLLFQLGWLHLEWRKPLPARTYFEQVIELRKKETPDQLKSIWTARTALFLCDRETKLDWTNIEKGVEEFIHHPRARRLAYLAFLVVNARKDENFQAVEKHYRELLGPLEETLGSTNPIYLLALGDFASALMKNGKYAEAFQVVIPLLKVGEKIAPQHRHLAETYQKLGFEMLLAKNYESAERYIRTGIEKDRIQKRTRREHQTLMAEAQLGAGKTNEATATLARIPVYRLSKENRLHYWLVKYRIAESCHDPTQTAIARCEMESILDQVTFHYQDPIWLQRFAIAAESIDRKEQAERLLRLALEKENRNRPFMHPRIAQCELALALLLLKDDRASESMQLLEQAEMSFRNRLPKGDQRLVVISRVKARLRRESE